jgi:hypothetical protein
MKPTSTFLLVLCLEEELQVKLFNLPHQLSLLVFIMLLQDQGVSTIMLEAAASHDLWIWHAFFGVPGSNNDINVLSVTVVYKHITRMCSYSSVYSE